MDALLTVKQVAERLQVDTKTVYRWIWAGHLPSLRLGPREDVLRIAEGDLKKYLEGHR